MSDVARAFEAEQQELRSSTRTATQGFVYTLCRSIVENVFKTEDAVRKLEARIAELEKSPLEYTGVHEAGKTYRRGQFATHNGSVWHAERTTAQRPGDGNAWTLACKAGRDAR